MKEQNSSVLITGASSGIGKSLAAGFSNMGFTTFGSVRSEADAKLLRAELGPNFIPLIFDVRHPEQIQIAFEAVQQHLKGKSLTYLINNAGVAMVGPIKDMPEDIFRLHYEVNVFGLINVTKIFLPLLGATKSFKGIPGTIVNISSIAGKLAPPFLGVYASSKFAVEALSHSLRRELSLYGIRVLIVGPGNVKTPIWNKGADISQYATSDYAQSLQQFKTEAMSQGVKGADSAVLAQEIIATILKEKMPVRIAPVKDKFKNWILPRMLSDRMLDKLFAKQFGLKK